MPNPVLPDPDVSAPGGPGLSYYIDRDLTASIWALHYYASWAELGLSCERLRATLISGKTKTMHGTTNEVVDVVHDAIPTIVQRALGMHNIQNQLEGSSSSSDGVICGLEGFLLPRYLSLRIGNHNYYGQQHQNNKTTNKLLPESLTRAQEEELQCRQTSSHPQNGSRKKVSKARKRKRKAHHRASNESQSVASLLAVGEDMPDKTESNHQNNGNRRRKRRRRSQGNAADSADAATNADTNSNISNKDWLHYQLMARIIIAPFTSSLIATVNRCKQIEKQKQHAKSGERSDCTAIPAVAEDISEASPMKQSTFTRNVYQKRRIIPNPQNNNFLILSTPQESLETIVDGSVCTLVRRTHRFRSSIFNRRNNGNGSASGKKGGKQIRYRRRQRRKLDKQKVNASDNATSKRNLDTNSNITSKSGQYERVVSCPKNNWMLEKNLLSTGYTLGNGETLTSSYSRTNNNTHHQTKTHHNKNNNNQILRGCPNMAPGVHCIHPNTLTSFAGSSPLMKCLHSIIGDDAMREILVNALVLIPSISSSTAAVDVSSTTADDEPKKTLVVGGDVSLFDRGNYFQLCGPPINILAKQFDGMSKSSGATKVRKLGHRKRKRNDVENEIYSPVETTTKDSSSSILSKSTIKNAHVKCNNKERSIIQKKERWDPNKPIPRGNLFYCDFYNKHVGLSPCHLLNQREEEGSSSGSPDALPTNSNVNVKLLNAMVRMWPSSRDLRSKENSPSHIVNCNKRRGRWRRLRESGIVMCQEMRRRQQQCDYTRLLEHHCSLPTNATTEKSSEGFKAKDDAKASLSHKVTLYTSAENVGSFLEAVLRSAFPTSFWGSIHNFRQVVRTARVFTNLGRTEQLPEKAIVDGIRVLDMKWLLPQSDSIRKPKSQDNPAARRRHSESATALLHNVMRWLYCKFIVPLLRSVFYITETEFTGSRVLYYRRPVWMRIKHLSMKLLLKQQYREINVVKAQKLLSSHNVGCPPAPLRLLPKKTGIRAIAMLSKSCLMEDTTSNDSSDVKEFGAEVAAAASIKPRSNSAPPNKILQSSFHALKYEHLKRPSLFGAGVLGLTEVFPSFCLFVEAIKKKQSHSAPSNAGSVNVDGGQNSLYFASADIKHCYDTINQKRLYKLMRSVIEEDVYLTKNNFILHSKDNNSSVRCRWKKSTFSLDQFSRYLTTSSAFADKYFRSIFVDGVHCSMEKKETIDGMMRDHIFGQVMVVANGNYGQRYLLQKDGIPQGSILSSMFCNIYFGNVEGFMLDDVFEKEHSHVIKGSSSSNCDAMFLQSQNDLHLLVRIVDDFLLISTNKDTSTRFLKKLNRGVPGLGVKINSEKSQVNYPISMENTGTGKVETVRACQDFFPWCGLLIDTRTCEVSLDHNRFSGSQATDTVVIHRAGSEGLALKKKMKDFVRPRCSQKLLFSSCINGIDMIRLNFYQTFLLCAIKTIHYMNGTGISSLKHQQFIYNSACDTIQFAFLLITSKIKHGHVRTLSSSTESDVTFQLAWKDALWLGRHAFLSAFQREGKQYAELCQLFSESSRTKIREGLLAVTRRALKTFPLGL